MAQAPAAPAGPVQTAKSAGPSTVGIVAGGVDSTGLRIASDLSRLIDGNDLRLISIVGKGSVQDIGDLLTLKSADIAIVQSDVLAHALAAGGTPGIQPRVKYVAKLYSEEFHVLSRMQFLCLADLNTRRVNFGPKGSGSAITAQAVFEANNISADPVYLEAGEAVERLKGANSMRSFTLAENRLTPSIALVIKIRYIFLTWNICRRCRQIISLPL